MSGRRLIFAVLLVVGTYFGGGAILHTFKETAPPVGGIAAGDRADKPAKSTTPAVEKSAAAARPGNSATPPSFVELKLNAEGEHMIAGRAAPSASVNALIDGKSIGEATADPAGTWMIRPGSPIPGNDYEITLKSTLPGAGNKTVTGQAARVRINANGRATVTIMRAPKSRSSETVIEAGEPAEVASSAKSTPAGGKTDMAEGMAPTVEKPVSDDNAGNSQPNNDNEDERIFDLASKIAKAATEKFSEIIGGGSQTPQDQRKIATAPNTPDTEASATATSDIPTVPAPASGANPTAEPRKKPAARQPTGDTTQIAKTNPQGSKAGEPASNPKASTAKKAKTAKVPGANKTPRTSSRPKTRTAKRARNRRTTARRRNRNGTASTGITRDFDVRIVRLNGVGHQPGKYGLRARQANGTIHRRYKTKIPYRRARDPSRLQKYRPSRARSAYYVRRLSP